MMFLVVGGRGVGTNFKFLLKTSISLLVKDTSDMINTLDYESMYTNIIHEEAVNAVRNTLETTDRHNYVEGIRRPKVESFCKLVDLAVKCNNFRFNGKNFYQSVGVVHLLQFAT